MTAPLRPKVLLTLVLAAALMARIGAGLWWQARVPEGAQFRFGDSQSYWQLGRAIARGHAYQYGIAEARVFRTPGYPLILAAVMKVAGPSALWARTANAVLGTLAVGGVYCLGRRLFDVPTGLMAAGIAACYPAAVVLGGLVLAETAFSALMVLQLVLWHQSGSTATPGGGRWWWFATGCAGGAATLVRPSWLLLTPVAAGCQMVVAPNHRRKVLRGMPYLFAGLLLTLLPWWTRNYRVTGHFVPTTLQVGASLYDGLNPAATGGSNMGPVQARQQALRQSLIQSGAATRQTVEFQVDRALRAAALDWARAHPTTALRLAAVKLARTWNVWPNEPTLRGWLARASITASYGPVLALAAVGLWKNRRRRWPCCLCLLPAIYFALLHTVFVGSIRYRQPAMLTLGVLAATVLVHLCRSPCQSLANDATAPPPE